MPRAKSRRAKLSNLRVAQMAAALWCVDAFCPRESTRRRNAARLQSLRESYEAAYKNGPKCTRQNGELQRIRRPGASAALAELAVCNGYAHPGNPTFSESPVCNDFRGPKGPNSLQTPLSASEIRCRTRNRKAGATGHGAPLAASDGVRRIPPNASRERMVSKEQGRVSGADSGNRDL